MRSTRMDLPGFLRIRAWNARQEQKKGRKKKASPTLYRRGVAEVEAVISMCAEKPHQMVGWKFQCWVSCRHKSFHRSSWPT